MRHACSPLSPSPAPFPPPPFPFSLPGAAARALLDGPLDAMAIAEKAMGIAADMCVYTNKNFVRDQIG
jgi:hypothetical protein